MGSIDHYSRLECRTQHLTTSLPTLSHGLTSFICWSKLDARCTRERLASVDHPQCPLESPMFDNRPAPISSGS